MVTPDYVRILKLDKIALKSKTYKIFLRRVRPRLHNARKLGVDHSFAFFVDRAWYLFGNGE